MTDTQVPLTAEALKDEVRKLAFLTPEEWDERRGGDPIARTINAVFDIIDTFPALARHEFKDEWRFQRSMSKGNPVAGKPIDPNQPCFICGVPFKDHANPAPAGLVVRSPTFRAAVRAVFEAPGEEWGPAQGYYAGDIDHFIDMLAAQLEKEE